MQLFFLLFLFVFFLVFFRQFWFFWLVYCKRERERSCRLAIVNNGCRLAGCLAGNNLSKQNSKLELKERRLHQASVAQFSFSFSLRVTDHLCANIGQCFALPSSSTIVQSGGKFFYVADFQQGATAASEFLAAEFHLNSGEGAIFERIQSSFV